jgi:hypothetical protein
MIRIRTELVYPKDLKPGELFSTVGDNYWQNFSEKDSYGERVYIRTPAPAENFEGAQEPIYRITIEED